MYFQSDYILRMIEMMGDFFRRLTQVLDDAAKAEAFDRAMRQNCGIDAKTAQGLTADSLIGLLPDQARLMLSEMMYIRAHAFKLDEEERENCLYKALRLLLSVGRENLLCELRKERLIMLYDQVYGLLSAGELGDVYGFLLIADDYARAEDVLFDAIETSLDQARQALIARGMEDYKALLKDKTDLELLAGGLPREEAMQSLNELKQMKDMDL